MIRGLAACLAGFLLLPCACQTRLAPPQVEIEEIDQLSDELAELGLDTMRTYVARLRAVSDPLRLHGAELCGDKIVPYLGVILESVGQGTPTPLDRVRRLRGIGASQTVVSVIADSPAAIAGVQPNDVIRSVNGRRVIRYRNFLERLRAGRDKGPELEIERDGERYELALSYLPACTPPPAFSPYGALSTGRNWFGVIVTRGLMDFVQNDDELAILIAHQMAHLIIDYRHLEKEVEARADRISLELARLAGYDIGAAPRIWEEIAVERPWMITTPAHIEIDARRRVNHGHIAARLLLMPRIITELEAKYPLAR